MIVSLDLYHINYDGNSNNRMPIRTAGVQFMRDNPERFIESNTENLWLRYLNNMCIQGTWTDAFIIQAVADALNVTIQIAESNQGFAPLTTVYPVQERNTSSTITVSSFNMTRVGGGGMKILRGGFKINRTGGS